MPRPVAEARQAGRHALPPTGSDDAPLLARRRAVVATIRRMAA